MSSFASRALVLSAARLFTQGMMMVSPILLVRLLDVVQYGQYRQFVVVCGVFTLVATFSIASHLMYFIARSPDRAQQLVSHAAMMLTGTSILAAAALVLLRDIAIPAEVLPYWQLMAVYVLLYVNLEFYVSYWLARKRSDRVLYYSVAEVSARIGTVVAVAWAYQDIGLIFLAMVAVEAVRVLLLAVWVVRSRLFTFRIDRQLLGEQVRFLLPLGTGSLLHRLNLMSGKYLVGLMLGPAPLAIFTIAAYKAPLMEIIKRAVSETIFPDMVERSAQQRTSGLRLWQRTNVIYLLLMSPACALLIIYAEPLVVLFFTAEYRDAAPLMQAMLLLMIIECFDFSVPLRSVAVNRPFVSANVVSLATNVAFTVAMMPQLGLWAPVVGILVSRLWVTGFLGSRVMQAFAVSLPDVLQWRKLGAVALATAAAGAAHAVVTGSIAAPVTATLAGLAAFVVVFVALITAFRVEEFHYLLNGLRNVLAKRFRKRVAQ